MIVTSSASSHQNSRSNQPALVDIDATQATVIAIDINSIMPGWRSRSSATAPARNGWPPHAKMNVPSTGPIHPTPSIS